MNGTQATPDGPTVTVIVLPCGLMTVVVIVPVTVANCVYVVGS